MSLEKLKADRYWLNKVMQFDHVIQVHEDGTVTEDDKGVYAPEVNDGELYEPCGWSLFTMGYTAQSGYIGPWMHPSEFIGGKLAEDILEQPGYYVAIVHDNGEEWAVAFKEATH